MAARVTAVEHLTLTVGDLTFDALAAGPPQGRPVLLLHGFPQSSREWEHLLGVLAGEGVRAVAPDQRGYSPGARPLGVPAYRMGHLVADTVGLLDALGWARADLVGHDWGAGVAWQTAGREQARVRSLVAVSVPHPVAFTAALRTDAEQREASQYMLRFREPEPAAEDWLLADDAAGLREFFAGADLAPGLVEGYVDAMRVPGALTAGLNWYRGGQASDITAMGPVTCPTTYVWSSGDAALRGAPARATGSHVEGPYTFVELDGVSHWVPEEAPDALAAIVLEHLARS